MFAARVVDYGIARWTAKAKWNMLGIGPYEELGEKEREEVRRRIKRGFERGVFLTVILLAPGYRALLRALY